MSLPIEFEVAISKVISHLDERGRVLKKRAGWSAEEDRTLKTMWGKRTQYDIARKLKRSRCSVKWRAKKLNLVEVRHA